MSDRVALAHSDGLDTSAGVGRPQYASGSELVVSGAGV
ncbi:hypothetical protein CLV54_2250 [Compostimonas suwonensis]|uniref:Uncharacterized protein n=1 Tax=Compostimonas suwonensis TaxID=1048394 RepID=A0A2M9BTN6_9MICO|nr:hypothetical protein CLV54_2250 [Compostimonas suwonensis]